MMRRAILIFLFIVLFLTPHDHCIGADFSADYDVSYAVSPTGNTIVTQGVTLTNNQTRLYPKQYTISIDTINIKNVIAYDNKGVISPTILQHNGKTEITLQFNEQIVGIGKKLTFTLRYENGDIATKNGTIWEVNIPGIEDDPTINTYSVSLQTPPTIGPNAYMKPLPMEGRKWNKNQMTQGGISAAYGQYQDYTVQINYDLENDKPTPAMTEITIPPDTGFQKVSVKSIDPKPKSMRIDQDGNWLALYDLEANEKLSVTAILQITTYIQQRKDFKVNTTDTNALLEPQQYWETANETIQGLGRQYKTAKDIFLFVVRTLTYDYARTDKPFLRKGAVEAVKTPQSSICSEFTDLFIAIARAAGIPAREIVGYAYTNNIRLRPLTKLGDVLHAWPEYYDATQNLWIPVDPTWENTTKGINYFDILDFNHITFAIHGRSSETPYPAGSFKEGAVPKKNVQVTFTETKQSAAPHTLKTTLEIPPIVTIGSPLNGTALIQNTSPTAIGTLHVSIQSDPFPISVVLNESNIPPYGVIKIPFTIYTKGIIPLRKGKITVTANDEISTFLYDMKPMYWLLIPVSMMGIGILILIWAFSKKR